MPDDSATQKAHAEQIKIERVMMDVTGLPRSALRRLETFQSRTNDRKAAELTATVTRTPATIKSEQAVMPGRGFGAGAEVAQNQQRVPAQAPTFTEIVLVDRVLKYALTHGTILGDV